MEEQLRKWAEDFPAYLSSRTDYAKGYKDGIVRAKQAVLEMLNEAELKEVEDCDIFSIYKENGVQMIKFLGYFYIVDDGWELVEFCWLDMPLSEYFAGISRNPDFVDEVQSAAKQYITDFDSVNEAYKALKGYKIKPLKMKELSSKTPEGVYY